jgi:hypothetical protein
MSASLRHASEHFRVEVDRGARRVYVRRLGVAFASRDDTIGACRPVLDVLDTVDRASHTLLFDAREAIGRNDPEYESWFAPHRREIVRDFARAAVVVKSASGKLQVARLATADRRELAVFASIDDAERYLDGG